MVRNDFKVVIGAFLAAMVGIVFLIQIADNSAQQTGTLLRINESISIASGRLVGNQVNNSTVYTVEKAPIITNNSALTGVSIRNSSGYVINGVVDAAITAAHNYTFNTTTGRFSMINTTFTVGMAGPQQNTTFVSYTYEDENFIDDASSRTVASLIPLITALAVLVAGGVVYFMKMDSVKNVLRS